MSLYQGLSSPKILKSGTRARLSEVGLTIQWNNPEFTSTLQVSIASRVLMVELYRISFITLILRDFLSDPNIEFACFLNAEEVRSRLVVLYSSWISIIFSWFEKSRSSPFSVCKFGWAHFCETVNRKVWLGSSIWFSVAFSPYLVDRVAFYRCYIDTFCCIADWRGLSLGINTNLSSYFYDIIVL